MSRRTERADRQERRGLRLVLADDHRLFLMGLRQLLAREPDLRIVAEATTGLEAVSAVAEHRPDILLLDISMPEMNGIEAARTVHAQAPETRIIILSMYADRRYVTEALRAGARGYLLKSSPPTEVLRAIRRVAAGQFHLAEGVDQVVAEVVQESGPASPSSAFGVLSAREREVLQLLAEGKSTKEIADLLHVSAKTVESHRQHLMEKLGLHTIAELVRYAIREGLSPLE